MKRLEVAVKALIRFALEKAEVTYGLESMMTLLRTVQSLTSNIMGTSGVGGGTLAILPQDIADAITDAGFLRACRSGRRRLSAGHSSQYSALS
ncbi:MAG: hypothetical protein LBU32_01565 [Clostridiales bacterium]|nr:hypothetical protein [Clostridiales bacterium]